MNQQNLTDNLKNQNFNKINLNVQNDYQKKIEKILEEINQNGKQEIKNSSEIYNYKQDIFKPDFSE